MSVYDMMVERGQKKELEAPVYPTLEQNNIVEQTEARIAESEKRAAEMERQAKRDRDMAIWGDLANLVVKGAAMHGGARKFNKDESATAKANERLRAVQKENIAQMATFAKERMAAADAARKERNAAKVAQFNAEMDAYKRAQAQANADRTHEETVRYHDEGLKIQQEREKRLGKQGDDKKTQALYDAYQELIATYPEFVVQKKIIKKNNYTGKWEVDEQGKYVYDYTDDDNPGIRAVENMLAKAKAEGKWDGSKVIEKPKAKKANPMGSGKKTNPMN